MAGEDVEFSLTGDASDVEAAIDDTVAALGRLAGATSTAQTGFVALKRGTDASDASTRKAAQGADAASKKIEGLKFASQAAGGRIGEMAGRVENAGRALGALGPAGAIGVAALAAVAVGVYGAVKAFGAGVAAASSMVSAFDAAHDSGVALGQDVGDRLDVMQASLEGVQVAGGLLVADVLTYWTPTIERFSLIAITGALELHDAWRALIGAAPTLTANLETLAKMGFGSVVEFADAMLDTQRQVLRAFGVQVPDALIEAGNAVSDYQSIIAGGIITATEDFAEAQGFSLDRGRQVIAMLGDATAAHEAHAEAVAADAKAALELDKAAALAAQSLQEMKSGGKDGLPFDKAATLAAQALQAQKTATVDVAASANDYTAAISTLSGVVGGLPDLFREGTRAAAVATKANGIVSGTVNAALAVLNTLANVPAPANIPAAVAVGAAGAAQVGIIAAQQPPSFDIGGTVTGGPSFRGAQSGQVLAQVQVGESILTRKDLATLQGMGGGGTTEVVLRVGARTVESMLVENARAGGTASRYSRSKGVHQRRYRGR